MDEDLNERSEPGSIHNENGAFGSLHSKVGEISVSGKEVARGVDEGPLAAKSAQLEEDALNRLREEDLTHGQVEMFNNPLSDQDASKFKRNGQNSISAYSNGSNRQEQNVMNSVAQLEEEKAK